MFDLLRTAESTIATEAAYRVSLRILEREHFRDWRRWLPLRPDSRLLPGAVELAERVLREIERLGGKPLSRLTDAELRPYQRHIDEILEARWAAEYPDPDGVGERILAEMRRDYALPEWRAVA